MRIEVLCGAFAIFLFLGIGHAQAQERVIFERVSALSARTDSVRRVVYLNQGWRNLRAIRFESIWRAHTPGGRDSGLSPISSSGYYFCGERAVAWASVIEPIVGDDNEEIIGVSPSDDVITLGALITDMQAGLRPYVRGQDEVDALLAALSPICATPPLRTQEPELLLMASSDDMVFHLVPNRFDRTGSVVRFWEEYRYTRTAQVTHRWRSGLTPDWSYEATILDPRRGHTLNQWEAHCGRSNQRLLRSFEYNSAGAVVNGSERPTDFVEVIPNSVGEGSFRVACLIH